MLGGGLTTACPQPARQSVRHRHCFTLGFILHFVFFFFLNYDCSISFCCCAAAWVKDMMRFLSPHRWLPAWVTWREVRRVCTWLESTVPLLPFIRQQQFVLLLSPWLSDLLIYLNIYIHAYKYIHIYNNYFCYFPSCSSLLLLMTHRLWNLHLTLR